MFEKFTRANAADFRQRYEGTHGFFRDEAGKRTLCQIVGIGENVCSFINARGVSFSVNADAQGNVGFEFIPPKSQFYNVEDGVYLVNRVAARQFQRGISGRNVSIGWLRGQWGDFKALRVEFPALTKIYEGAISPKDAVKRLTREGMDKYGAFAISGQIAFGNGGSVFLYDKLIGAYNTEDFKKLMVKLDEPTLWRTEITDALRALDKTVEVV